MQSVLRSAPVGLPVPSRGRDLPAALLRLADADADALADRLHDDVLQLLVVARYATDAVARGAAPSVARDAVQDALVALRRTVWQLRPRTAPGLGPALDELAAQRVAAGLSAPDLDVDPSVAQALGPTSAAAAYRLVQAVLQEAGDQPVRVVLSRSGDRASLDVTGALADPSGWSLRARGLGGQLVVGPDRLRLLLLLEPGPDHPPARLRADGHPLDGLLLDGGPLDGQPVGADPLDDELLAQDRLNPEPLTPPVRNREAAS